MSPDKKSQQSLLLVNLTTRDNNDMMRLITKSDTCNTLELDNKYYKATVQCEFFKPESPKSVDFSNCHAIIIFVDVSQDVKQRLDSCVSNLSEVGGEPRILAHFEHAAEDGVHNLNDLDHWCTENGYQSIPMPSDKDADNKLDDALNQCCLIDCLSAYKWPHMTMKNQKSLSEETMKKLEDFDDLLNQINMYREMSLTGGQNNSSTTNNDDMLTKIAERISSIMGEDFELED